VEVPAVAEGGAVVPRSSVAEVVMAVDVAVAAMAHGEAGAGCNALKFALF